MFNDQLVAALVAAASALATVFLHVRGTRFPILAALLEKLLTAPPPKPKQEDLIANAVAQAVAAELDKRSKPG